MSKPILIQDEDLQYSGVQQAARKRLGLSYNEYHVADTIYHLSTGDRGHCYMSIPSQAEYHDLSVRGVKTIIDKLIDLGLVVKVMYKGQTIGWNTTQAWRGVVVVAHEKRKAHYAKSAQSEVGDAKNAYPGAKSAPDTVQKVHEGSAKSAHNIDTNINKDITNNTPGDLKDSYFSRAINQYIAEYTKEHRMSPGSKKVVEYQRRLKTGESLRDLL